VPVRITPAPRYVPAKVSALAAALAPVAPVAPKTSRGWLAQAFAWLPGAGLS
jgi:hypothetical protein